MHRFSATVLTVLALVLVVGTVAAYAARPSVTINQWNGQLDPTGSLPIVFRVAFDQEVTDFTLSDVTITGSAPGTKAVTLTEIAPFDGTTYEVSVTGLTGSGTVTASIAEGVAHNSSGEPNFASTSADNTVTYDITRPTVSLVLAEGQKSPTNDTLLEFDLTFSEAVISGMTKRIDPDPDKPDDEYLVWDTERMFTITGSAASCVEVYPDDHLLAGDKVITFTGGGTSWHVTVKINRDLVVSPQMRTIAVIMNADAMRDLVGNGNLASTGLDNTVILDYFGPRVSINQATTQPDPTNKLPIHFTAEFTERVVDMKESAITVLGATEATVTVLELPPFDGTVFDIAVDDIPMAGVISATIAEGAVHDAAGNKNLFAISTDNEVTYIPDARSVEITHVEQADPTNESPIHFKVEFSDEVDGFTDGDVTLGGTAEPTTAIVTNPSGDKRTFDVAVSGMAKSGTVIIGIPASVVDEPGNLSSWNYPNTDIVDYDITRPTVLISRAPTQPGLTNSKPVMFRAVFSEPIEGFTGSDVILGGTALGDLTASVSEVSPYNGTTYNIYVSGMTASGTVTATIGADAVEDAAGNRNFAATTQAVLMYDIDSPTVVVERAADQPDPTSIPSVDFTVRFSENVSGFTAADVAIGGTAGGTTAEVFGGGSLYTVRITGMTTEGTVVVAIPAGVAQDDAGNGNLTSTGANNSVNFDAIRPRVTVNQADDQADPTKDRPVLFTVVFSEPVIGFIGSGGKAKVELSGTAGATSAIATDTGDGATYTVAVSGMTQAGTITVVVLEGVVQDAAGNPNNASTSVDNTVTFDIGPTVTINQAGGQADPTSGQPINFTVVFSDPVTGFDKDDIIIEGTAGGSKKAVVTGSGATYNVAITGMTSSGTVIASVRENAAKDSRGDWSAASTSTDNTVIYDITRPTVTINQTAGQDDPTYSPQIRFTVVFSEPVVGFSDGDVVVSGTAGATNAYVIGAGTDYEVIVTGMTQTGSVIVTIPANVAHDASGNSNLASTSYDNRVQFEDSLSATIEQAEGQEDPAETGPISFRVSFSKPVDGFTADDVTISGTAGFGTRSVVIENQGDYANYIVRIYGMNWPGTVVANIAAGVVHDETGHPNAAAVAYDNSVTYQPVQPSVIINQAENQDDPTNAGPIAFSVEFSTEVTGFTSSDVTISGTAGGNKSVSVTGTGAKYTVYVTGMTSSGTVVATIGPNVAFDSNNNGNMASVSTDNVVGYDTIRPSVTINQAADQTDPTTESPVIFTAVFSEPVLGFDETGVTLGGTAGPTTAVVTETVPYDGTTYKVAVSGMTGTGTVTASVKESAVRDKAGNDCRASTSSDNKVTMLLAVTVNQAAGQNDPTNDDTINFTAVFSETVEDFDEEDVIIGGSAGATTAEVTGGGKIYNIAISGMTRSGSVTASVKAGSVHDSSGGGNSASTSTDNMVIYDDIAPTVTVKKAATQSDPTSSSAINFIVLFSEAVYGFSPGDVTIGGTAGATAASVIDTGDHKAYNIIVTGMTKKGTVSISIPAGAARDAAGNNNTASGAASVSFDNVVLTVTVNQAAEQADPTNSTQINFTAVFSKPVTEFDASHITLSGTAGANTATITDSGDHMTYNIAVDGMTRPGTVIVSIPANSVLDVAGNYNRASTSTDATVVYDNVGPTVTVNKSLTQADPTSASSIYFTVTFSEAVIGFDASDLTVGGSAGATMATITASSNNRNFTVAVSGMTNTGTVSLSVQEGVAHDAAGNPNDSSSGGDNSVTFEKVGPTLTLSLAEGQSDPATTSPIYISAVFSEAVTDFTSTDVDVSGTAGGPKVATLTGSGATYSIAVSGVTTSGTVIVKVPAGMAHNALGDTSTAAEITVRFDNDTPTVTINSPTPASSCTRNTPYIDLSGTASDSVGINRVTWSSTRSGSGECTGTAAWSCYGIKIVGGSDTITITAYDEVGNTATDTISVNVVDASPGSAWDGLAMVSLPIIPDQTDPKSVCGFQSNSWVTFDTGLNVYLGYPDQATWFNPASATPGRGFWARFSGTPAAPRGIVPPQNREAVIHLEPGWNLIGQPFIKPVTWDVNKIMISLGGMRKAIKNATAECNPFAWGWNSSEGDYYLIYDTSIVPDAVEVMQPWQAYWIKAMVECDLIIPAP